MVHRTSRKRLGAGCGGRSAESLTVVAVGARRGLSGRGSVAGFLALQSVLGSSMRRSDAVSPGTPEQRALHRYVAYQASLPMAEIALPAAILGDPVVMRWVRERRIRVEVRTAGELVAVIGAGVHPAVMCVDPEAMTRPGLVSSVALGVGAVVVTSPDELDSVSAMVRRGRQGVVVRIAAETRSDSDDISAVARAALGSKYVRLVGLRCEIGTHDADFVSYPAAIGHMIAQMARIRSRYGIQLSVVWLGGGHVLPSSPSPRELNERAEEIDIALDDACVTMGFPRPTVVLATEPAIVTRWAA